jgi:hypothetical protein
VRRLRNDSRLPANDMQYLYLDDALPTLNDSAPARHPEQIEVQEACQRRMT